MVLLGPDRSVDPSPVKYDGSLGFREPRALGGRLTLEGLERIHIHLVSRTALADRGGCHDAERLGLEPSTLRSRMKKLRIRRPRRPEPANQTESAERVRPVGSLAR